MGNEELTEKPKRSKRTPEPIPFSYVVLTGFNYGPEDVRVTPGPLTVELPADVLADLIEAKAIQEVSSGS